MYGSTATTNNVRSDDKTASMTSLLGGGAFKKESNGSTLHGSLEDLLATESLVDGSRNLSNHGSMWLGTEDGKFVLLIFVVLVKFFMLLFSIIAELNTVSSFCYFG